MTQPATADRETLRNAIGAVLVNASNYPEQVQSRLLGRDLTDLIDRTTDAASGVIVPANNIRADECDRAAAEIKAEIERLEVVKGTYAKSQQHVLGLAWASLRARAAELRGDN